MLFLSCFTFKVLHKSGESCVFTFNRIFSKIFHAYVTFSNLSIT